MFWTKSKKLALFKGLRNLNCKNGASCVFVPLSKTVGAKLYGTKKERDWASALQKLAAKHNLAPRVGENFKLDFFFIDREYGDPFIDDTSEYGYLTEIAKMREPAEKRVQELDVKLMKVGIDHGDLHMENVGFLRGRVVCIDFDSASCKKIKNG